MTRRLSLVTALGCLTVACTAQTLVPRVPATPAPTPSSSAPAVTPVATPAPIATPAPSAAAQPASTKITYSQCHVDGPYVAITFDDGPHASNTPRLLDMLKQRKAKATF